MKDTIAAQKPLYALNLKLEGKQCLVVGAGPVGTQKIESLLECGACVQVISPETDPSFLSLWQDKSRNQNLHWEKRRYQSGEAKHFGLVIAATNEPETNEQIYHEARAGGALVNVVDVPHLCDFYVPAVMRRGRLQISIQSGGAYPALSGRIRRDLERYFPPLWETLFEELADYRQKIIHSGMSLEERGAHLKALANSSAIDEYLQGNPAQLQLLFDRVNSVQNGDTTDSQRANHTSQDEKNAHPSVEHLESPRTPMTAESLNQWIDTKNPSKGFVSLVGAGPGDAGLLTVRGKELLEQADAVVYDALANHDLLQHCKPEAEFHFAGKRAGFHHLQQDEINELLVALAKHGKKVVRLKGGDPYIFGRGGEEADYLRQHNIAFEVIPGIPAALGAGAFAGIPLTDRRYSTSLTLTTFSRSEENTNWQGLAHANSTLVFYMAMNRLDEISERLITHGLSPETPAAVVEWATTPHQKSAVSTLKDLPFATQEQGLKAPALVIIGESVQESHKLNWFEHKELYSKRIVVAGSADRAGVWSRKLELKGAWAKVFPIMQTQLIPDLDNQPIMELLRQKNPPAPRWLVFSSIHGARWFFEILKQNKLDSRALGSAKILAMGQSTAQELVQHGIQADLIPQGYDPKNAFKELYTHPEYAVQDHGEQQSFDGPEVILIRSKDIKNDWPQQLQKAGARVHEWRIYETGIVPEESSRLAESLDAEQWDVMPFTSSAQVHLLASEWGAETLRQRLKHLKLVSIGPETTRALAKYGLDVSVEANPHTLDGLVDAVGRVEFSSKMKSPC